MREYAVSLSSFAFTLSLSRRMLPARVDLSAIGFRFRLPLSRSMSLRYADRTLA